MSPAPKMFKGRLILAAVSLVGANHRGGEAAEQGSCSADEPGCGGTGGELFREEILWTAADAADPVVCVPGW